MLTPEQRQIIKKARDRIADPAHWCKGANARSADGRPCHPAERRAVRFSVFGALVAEYVAQGVMWPVDVVHELSRQLHPQFTLWHINEYEGHAAVLAIFDKALAE